MLAGSISVFCGNLFTNECGHADRLLPPPRLSSVLSITLLPITHSSTTGIVALTMRRTRTMLPLPERAVPLSRALLRDTMGRRSPSGDRGAA
jgi:hypothetical protein